MVLTEHNTSRELLFVRLEFWSSSGLAWFDVLLPRDLSYSVYDNLLELWISECLGLACNSGIRSSACDQPSKAERSDAESPSSCVC